MGIGQRTLIIAACAVIVIAGLRAAEPLVVPVLMAGLLALVCVPPMRRLQRVGVNEHASLMIVIAVATTAVLFFLLVVGGSITQFRAQLPFYSQQLDLRMAGAFVWLDELGVDTSPEKVRAMIDTGRIMQLVGDITGGILVGLGNVFIVVLTMIFILLEVNGFSRKLRLALGDPGANLGEWRNSIESVYQYLFIKAGVSAITGALVSALTFALQLDFPLLWGLVAFLFNFVPNIGSIIAAIPAVLLAWIQHGPGNAALVGAGYLIINTLIGNVLEPQLMGRRLGMSPLVVLLSLIFWGWVWGPVGMLLSVPLTVILKIMLEHSDDFRGVAVLLGPAEDPHLAAAREAAGREQTEASP